jgi:hypothetical protein
MRPLVGSAAVAIEATPQSAESGGNSNSSYPTLEALAAIEGPLPAPFRARVRAIMAEPLADLHVHLERAEAAATAVDPEYGAFLLVEFLRELGPKLERIEARLSRAFGPNRN